MHGSILDGSFLFPSGSMLLLHVKGRIKLGLCKQPFFILKDVDLDVKTPLRRAPKACEAFFVRFSTSSDSLRSWLMIDPR